MTDHDNSKPFGVESDEDVWFERVLWSLAGLMAVFAGLTAVVLIVLMFKALWWLVFG